MDEFAELWFLVSDHVQAHLAVYLLGFAAVAPLVYFTRRWAVPLILYIIEICVYFCLMHAFVHMMVGLAAWFKTAASSRALRPDGLPLDAVFWSTPVVKFWEKTLYDPPWVLYLECVLAVVIVLLVLKFRPLRTQKAKPRFTLDGSKKEGSVKDSQTTIAQKYGSKRYSDDWTKEATRPPTDSRIHKR